MTAVAGSLREELFSLGALEQHARDLAARHRVTTHNGKDFLLSRLAANERVLRAYNEETLTLQNGQALTPAAEWLLDNFYLIEEQVRLVRRHLPRGFSRELPHLTTGPNAQQPRVYDLALQLIAHVDARVDREHLTRFVAAYQEVAPLKLGELWAVPIMLRLALIENLRRVSIVVDRGRCDREAAEEWVQRMQDVAERNPSQLIVAVGEMAEKEPNLSSAFVTEFWRRTQEKSPAFTLALGWIESRLSAEGTTIEQMVHLESQSQAANQVSVGNSISSLRFLDATDWRDFVESLSIVETVLRTDPAAVYPRMDFVTRDAYRHVVERVAKYGQLGEADVASLAIRLARTAQEANDTRRAHIGYYLIDKGVADLERQARVRVPLRELLPRLSQERPLMFYLGGIVLITALTTYTGLQLITSQNASLGLLGVLVLLLLLCASQLGVSVVNWLTTLLIRPRSLPRLDFSAGIPPEHRTMVVVPTMLTSPAGIERLLEGLEVHYLANRDENVYFGLLTDFRDAPDEHLSGDAALVGQVRTGIEALNAKYQPKGPQRFYLFHRNRRWNEQERQWMGYERKRGKLLELNRCLRGNPPHGFAVVVGNLQALPRIRYVITLDTDTQLPRDTARQLAGSMGHVLNRPVYDAGQGRVVAGYGILQPRVAVSLPSAGRSRFAKLFAGESGIDPYTRTVSDVYQDLFQEGSFIGKGIYDVDAFDTAVGDKFPENRILSHDLLEGSYARSGLVTDVLLFEEFPSRYTTDTRRRHRWMRGDWQIANWLLPRVPGSDVRQMANPISGLSRWKIFDNLRRSLAPVALLGLLMLGWLAPSIETIAWTVFIACLIVLPGLLTALTGLVRKPKDQPPELHLRNVLELAVHEAEHALLTLVFLPFDACISLDATLRTLGRLLFTRRHLLEWQTASDSETSSQTSFVSYLKAMWFAPAMAMVVGLAFPLLSLSERMISIPFLLLWLGAPAVAWWISRPLSEAPAGLDAGQQDFLRRLARRTWAFFETYVGPEENWLPPDNFQEQPKPLIASRTSPTNIGMALLSTLGAWDLGHVSTGQLVLRIGACFETLGKMDRYRGHFYNWYDTRTLQPLPPLYISTVDNGNFSGLVLTLRAGLVDLAANPGLSPAAFCGLNDTLQILQETKPKAPVDETVLARLKPLGEKFRKPPASLTAQLQLLRDVLAALGPSPEPGSAAEFQWWQQSLERQCRAQVADMEAVYPWLKLQPLFEGSAEVKASLPPALQALWQEVDLATTPDQVRECLKQLRELLAAPSASGLAEELKTALLQAQEVAAQRTAELEELARKCGEFAEMDFGILYDSSRELFSIGYSVANHRLDSSFYDLLASEARLTSFVAIALGQVPQDHWFTLGRLLTAVGDQPALISWSGSMFEYLMPPLIMPEYEDTLLDVSDRAAVARQISYGKQLNIPWGVSESGYNLTDAQSNYQYRAFGVPGLGFKRGLTDDVVVAPYASVMGLLVAPGEACRNLERLRDEGALARYGFYEALDYTPSRVAPGHRFAMVRSFMAHHQGMSLLALVSRLLDRPMQRRFQSIPMFKAAELLLQERVPRETSFQYPHELESSRAHESALAAEPSLRVFRNPDAGGPEVHLLSNGRYHVMVTSAGGGYSRWNDTALTRWQEDPTRDCWGSFIYVRDRESGKVWSTAHQPILQTGEDYEAIFSQGKAEFRSRMEDISSHTEISVSPEEDVEVRRITLTNHSDEPRVIELTSYAEVTLSSQAADLAHPAFNKLFVQTQILTAQDAILCSRRPRTRTEQPPWMFQLMLVTGKEAGVPSFETDRSKFLGRTGSIVSPLALQTGQTELSNTQGSVLDPILAIRRTVWLEPKQSACAILVTGGAANREAALNLVDKYHDRAIDDRVFELAWTHGMVTLRHLNATEAQAQMFDRLAGALIYTQPQRRAPASVLLQNTRSQRNLWSFGISGDLPILLLRATGAEGLGFVHEVVQAHAYWRLKGLTVDLVVVNHDDTGYRQAVNDQIMAMIASSISAQMLGKPGGIFVLRSDQLSAPDLVLLQAAARVVLSAESGTLAELMQRRARLEPVMPPLTVSRRRKTLEVPAELPPRELIFFNGLGGFTPDGREYVIQLTAGQTTPAPWINVLGNPEFGTIISESGGSYSWGENCHEFRLTTWYNDPVCDHSGEAFYVRDEHTGRFWSPTPMPARGTGPYVTRHGFGYTVFEHTEAGISTELWVYVAMDAPVKFARLIVRNASERDRSLSLTGYWEWVLGELRHRNIMHIVTEFDARNGAVFARNAYNADFPGRVAFVSASETPRSHTADRTEFIGRNRSQGSPAALSRARLSGKTGPALDACAALQLAIDLAPGEEREIVFKVGVGKDRNEAVQLVQRFRSAESARKALEGVWAHWGQTLGAFHVETPDPAVNVLANGWLPYQTMSCRLWARGGFYQSGGAFGFRDQLQDAMAVVHARPELLHEQILRAAAHQFREGDVQHWWHPPTGRGVRTHFSDDYLWLPLAVCRYVESTGELALLDERLPFLEGRLLRPDEEAYYDSFPASAETSPLYDHCVRAIRNGLKFGEHGLPLMGCGDWNDGMNLIGEHGKGESVWLAFFLFEVLNRFAELARRRGDGAFAEECAKQAAQLRQNVERHAWDGRWYRRAYFDDGRPLGSASNEECQIDALPQSWAVLSQLGDPDRCRTALEAVAHRLVRRDARLIQLFDPPFDKSSLEPGYIKGYVPGVRENGGQYTHAAIWTVMAFAQMGEVQRAWEFFDLINPVGHSSTPPDIARYKVEPYVVAADVYSISPHTGRGGWTWYTGSAGWMYRLISETLLGLRPEGGRLHFKPCLRPEWKSFQVRYRHQDTYHHVTLVNQSGTWKGEPVISVDGQAETGGVLRLRDDHQDHTVEVRF